MTSALLAGTAAADSVAGASGVSYVVPFVNGGWPQKRAGKDNKIIVFEEPGHTPTQLSGVEFPSSVDRVSLESMERRLESQLRHQDGVTFFGQKVTEFKLNNDGKTTVLKAPAKNAEMYLDVNARLGTATINGLAARYMFTQVPGGKYGTTVSVFVVVAAKGTEKRVFAVFDEIVRKTTYLKRGGESTGGKPAPEPQEKPYVPVLTSAVFAKEVTATSTFADKKGMYAPWRVFSFDDASRDPGEGPIPKTAWCEGKPDEGVGEGITLTLASPTKIDRLEIAGGVWLTEKLFKANNYVSSLAVTVDGRTQKVALPKKREWETVKIGRTVSKIEIKVDAVTKGKMNDSCISGVTLWANDQQLGVLTGIDPAAAAALPKALVAIYQALEAPDRKGLEQHLSFPFSFEDSSTWGYGDAPATKHKNWKSVDAACKAEAPYRAGDKEWPEGKARKCPGAPNVREEYEPQVEGSGTSLQVRWPSGREVADMWNLEWKGGAWKLSSIWFGT